MKKRRHDALHGNALVKNKTVKRAATRKDKPGLPKSRRKNIIFALAVSSLLGCAQDPNHKPYDAGTISDENVVQREDASSFDAFLTRAFGISHDIIKQHKLIFGNGFDLFYDGLSIKLMAGEHEVMTFDHSYSKGVDVNMHVSESVARGFLQMANLTDLYGLLKLGPHTDQDLTNAKNFLDGLGEDYQKKRSISQLVILNTPKQEYSESHETIEDVLAVLRDNEFAFFVSEDEGAIADSELIEWLYTVQAASCSILILYDTHSKIGAIAHISADDMTPEATDKFIEKYIEVIGDDKGGVEVFINFGWFHKDSKVILTPLEKHGLLENVTETNLSYAFVGKNPPLFIWIPAKDKHLWNGEPLSVAVDGSGSIADSAAINLKTGKIYHIQPSGLIGLKDSKRNLGNPIVITK